MPDKPPATVKSMIMERDYSNVPTAQQFIIPCMNACDKCINATTACTAVGCVPCIGCAGCALKTADTCVDCIKMKQEKNQQKNPNYDPRGVSVAIDNSTLANPNAPSSIDKNYIFNYIKSKLNYPADNERIMSDFENILSLVTYSGPIAPYNRFYKPEIDQRIAQLNATDKKTKGGKNKTKRKQRKRRTMRKYKKGKRKSRSKKY